MIHFALLFSRQGKVRLSKYYKPYSQKERAKLVKEVTSQILSRPSKLCNVVEHRNLKLIYKRYASLYFTLAVDDEENELIVLEMIQHYVEILDRYFGNVCELDLIFNFHKAYYLLDEVFVAGRAPGDEQEAHRAVSERAGRARGGGEDGDGGAGRDAAAVSVTGSGRGTEGVARSRGERRSGGETFNVSSSVRSFVVRQRVSGI